MKNEKYKAVSKDEIKKAALNDMKEMRYDVASYFPKKPDFIVARCKDVWGRWVEGVEEELRSADDMLATLNRARYDNYYEICYAQAKMFITLYESIYGVPSENEDKSDVNKF